MWRRLTAGARDTGPTQAFSRGPCIRLQTGSGPRKPRTPGKGRHLPPSAPAPWCPEWSRHTRAPSWFAPAGPAQHLGGKTPGSPHTQMKAAEPVGGALPGARSCYKGRGLPAWPLREGTKQTWVAGGSPALPVRARALPATHTHETPVATRAETPSSERRGSHSGLQKTTARGQPLAEGGARRPQNQPQKD